MKMRLVAGGAALLLAFTAAACSDDKDTTTPGTEAGGGETESTDGGGEDNGGGGGGGDAAAGAELYATACVACHGADAKGLPNLGKDLTASDFVNGLSDEELVAFIAVGRAADDAANTTGVAMPPKGGNPALTDEDLLNLVAHIRSLSS